MKKTKEPRPEVRRLHQEGRYKATCQRKFQLPWREAGPPKKIDDQVDSDEKVDNKEVSLYAACLRPERSDIRRVPLSSE